MRRPRPLHTRPPFAIALASLALLAGACNDNVGRAFDPGAGGGGGGGGPASNVAVVPIGGDVADGRPRVRAVYPDGVGWPGTVPVVVVFNESMSEESIAPSGNGTPTLTVRAKGTEQALPGTYDFLLGGKVVVFRPSAPFPNQEGASFEVVIDPEARDVDGVRYGGSAPKVLAEFTPNQDTMAVKDAQILTVLPEDNSRDVPRESPIYVIFTKPVVPTSVDENSFVVRPQNGNAIAGARSFPLMVGSAPDPRVLRFESTDVLPGDVRVEVVVNDAIKTAEGKLDFRGRTPFAGFTTLPFEAPATLAIGNVTPGFPDKINRQNLANVQVDVGVPASALAGDRVLVRLYGLDAATKPDDDVDYVERTATVPMNGAQTVTVTFAAALGTLAKPVFEEGELTIAAQLERGARATGFVHSPEANAPRLDLTPPVIARVGPPASGDAALDLITDQEDVAFHGRASEQLAAAELTAGGLSATLHASAADGRFLLRPLFLGRRTAPLDYQLVVTDAAGNMAEAPSTGRIVQRGVVTGSVAGGTLVVEVYDEATLQPVPGAVVLVEPGMPQKPASGRLPAVATGADGRATFTGLSQPRHTITIVRDGYHLRSLLATEAGFVSLPLRPLANATATISGTAAFLPTTGTSALVGVNVLDDPLAEAIGTTASAPTTVPATAIRPNRPLVVSAFAGIFEPTQVTTFSFGAMPMATPAPPLAPAAPAGTTAITLNLLAATGTTQNLAAPYMVDFASATGLDTGNLVGTPRVRILGSLRGLPGMTLFGVGFATPSSGAAYTVHGSYSLASAVALAAFMPVFWVSTEATDTAGNVSRHRQLILDNAIGTTFPTVPPLGIPVVTAPGGPSTGAPEVTYQDRLNPAGVPGGFAFAEVIATDAAGRSWSLLRQDQDGATGAVTVQFPDLAGTALTGLANGAWSVHAESWLLFTFTFTNGDYVLEERRRQQIGWARADAQVFMVQ